MAAPVDFHRILLDETRAILAFEVKIPRLPILGNGAFGAPDEQQRRPGSVGIPAISVQTHSEDSIGDGGPCAHQKSCHTGEGRCPWQNWVPAFAGKTRKKASH
jgi:hypothetical protein